MFLPWHFPSSFPAALLLFPFLFSEVLLRFLFQWCYCGSLMFLLLFLLFSLCFLSASPMLFLQLPCYFSMLLLSRPFAFRIALFLFYSCLFKAAPMSLLLFFRDVPMFILWFSFGLPQVFLCVSNGAPVVPFWLFLTFSIQKSIDKSLFWGAWDLIFELFGVLGASLDPELYHMCSGGWLGVHFGWILASIWDPWAHFFDMFGYLFD